MGVAPNRSATPDKVDDCSGVNPPSGKKRHVRNTVAGERIDQGIVGPMDQIVLILHTHDLANLRRIGNLLRRDIAQTNVAH